MNLLPDNSRANKDKFANLSPTQGQQKSYRKHFALGAAALLLLGAAAYSFSSQPSEGTGAEAGVGDGHLQSLYKLETDDKLKGYCRDTKKRCNVLVVVDMQNDYCKGCQSPTESPWSTDAVLKIAPNINKAIQLRKDGTRQSIWDLVIFTKDSLQPGRVCVGEEKDSSGKCTKGSSLVSYSQGNQVISALHTPVEVPFIEFTKNNDDWLNEIHSDYRGVRAYSIENESLPGIEHPTLRQMLDYREFDPKKTTLFVTGVQTNRCVLKGAVHGTVNGYKVAVLKDSVAGASAPDNWRTVGDSKNAPARPCQHCTPAQLTEWKKQIYTGYKGGPESMEALKYMKEAGVDILSGASAINDYLKSSSDSFLQ